MMWVALTGAVSPSPLLNVTAMKMCDVLKLLLLSKLRHVKLTCRVIYVLKAKVAGGWLLKCDGDLCDGMWGDVYMFVSSVMFVSV